MDRTFTQDSQETAAATAARIERHKHEARVRHWRVLVVSAFFIVVVGANIFVGGVVLMGSMRTQAAAAQEAAAHRTGRISRPMLDGVFCRTTVFNSNSGHTIEDKVGRCDEAVSNRKSEFSWGGK